MLFIIYLPYIFLIGPLLEARTGIQKYFCCFLVQMKTSKFAFEIYWPLVHHCCSYCLLTIKRLLIFHLSSSLASRDERKKGLELHKQHVKQIHKRGKWSKAEFLSSGTFHDSFLFMPFRFPFHLHTRSIL